MAAVQQSTSTEDLAKTLRGFQTAIEASSSTIRPLLAKARSSDDDLDLANGLSLLLIRPQVLLETLHHMVLLLALRLSGKQVNESDRVPMAANSFIRSSARDLATTLTASDNLREEITVNQETLDKVRSLEGKLEYQIKKLSALAQADEASAKHPEDDIEEDPLAFRPDLSAMVASTSQTVTKPRLDENQEEVYRPPRVAAMPYNEPNQKVRERRAPALLSEFAHNMEGAPQLETTSGLSTIPTQARTNSASAKRAAELQRINAFEEENMTRLVTTKREQKRRREDEAALALGYGVGGTGRQRGNRQNGLEAELEGVLGDRRSGGIWNGVGSKLGSREGLLDRGKRRVDENKSGKAKKARFEQDVERRRGGKR